MAPLRISFLIRSVYDLVPSNANLVRWGKKDDPTCPLCQGRQTTEHVLSSCKVALSQGRYTWRHNRVLQELASVMSTAKEEIHPSSTSSTVFTAEEEYKCGKARLLTMLEESDDPVVKTAQPSLKIGRQWKVTEAVDEAKECLKMKEVIGQTQTDRRGLGSTTAKRWSKTEGKEKRDMIIDEIRNKEDSTRVQKAVQQPQQGQWTNWDTAIQRSLTWNDI
ncbi:reverse transcriptase [Plakobranchus ocellatus]|uniref:Reverse transcriptase n=1 Tax=Plakobranchus ocellatus TaxID=259542 RepID=A0AAV4AHG3_9GAST|nr:reverse transcriptase [Plakobranchus ocellatus]